jgi:hypothetical protein
VKVFKCWYEQLSDLTTCTVQMQKQDCKSYIPWRISQTLPWHSSCSKPYTISRSRVNVNFIYDGRKVGPSLRISSRSSTNAQEHYTPISYDEFHSNRTTMLQRTSRSSFTPRSKARFHSPIFTKTHNNSTALRASLLRRIFNFLKPSGYVMYQQV